MNKTKTIAFMTTLGVNVGDEFIREGIFSFLDEIFDKWTPLYVNKHDLSTLSRSVSDEILVLGDKFKDADIIIQAGAPVYWKIGQSTSYNVEWAEELWRKRIFQLGPKKPILNIAAGACQPYPDSASTFIEDQDCVRFAQDVASACRWTSVRDPIASQILSSLGISHDVLPCTAFHAARRTNFKSEFGGVVGVNLMPLGGHFKLKEDINENEWVAVIKTFLPAIRKNRHIIFIAHDVAEKEFMSQFQIPGELIFCSGYFRDYFPIYSKCSAVIANRVHGAVCAAGFGRPSLIIGNDTRMQIGDYIGLPSRYVGKVTAEEIIGLFESIIQNEKKERDRLINLRDISAIKYQEAILENVGTL